MTEKILVVEDTEKHLAGLKPLRESGLEIDIARDFFRVMQYLKDGRDFVDYNAVLTDLMFPFGGGRYELVNFDEAGEYKRYEEQPLGYAVALCAAKLGVPLIGIVTDMSHHAGPIAGTFDFLFALPNQESIKFFEYGEGRPIFRINNSKLVMFDDRDVKGLYLNRDGILTSDKKNDSGQIKVKNWPAIYDALRSIK